MATHTPFSEIFDEYYTLFRGQVQTIANTDPEWLVGIRLANQAIRKHARADGQLWREFIVTLQAQAAETPAIVKTLVGGTVNYICPTNMRKPPYKVRFYNGSTTDDITVIDPQNIQKYTDTSTFVWFEGSATSGYIMHVSTAYSNQRAGWAFDYIYIKNPEVMAIATPATAGTFIPELSDPNFIIQDMLASRYANSRNGFGYKTAKADAQTALANMKIENNSGMFNQVEDWFKGSGWGAPINGGSGLEMSL